jgi:hypothetical protein
MRVTDYESGEAQDRTRIKPLVAEVKKCHLAAVEADKESERLAKKSTQLGKQTGLGLLQLQKIVGYGHWRRWFEKNKNKLGGFSSRTARFYMQLAELPESDWQRVANLPLRQAMKAIADGNPPGTRTDPTLTEPYLTFAHACVQHRKADVVISHLRSLKRATPVSPDRLDRAGKAWKRLEAGRKRMRTRR